MISLVLVLVYVMSGNLVVKQIPVKDEAECMKRGQAIIEQLADDPKFNGGLFAGCVPLKLKSVKS